jgi:hypothetical protein
VSKKSKPRRLKIVVTAWREPDGLYDALIGVKGVGVTAIRGRADPVALRDEVREVIGHDLLENITRYSNVDLNPPSR